MVLKMVIPKGRMNQKVVKLLADAGVHLSATDRSYRPLCNDDNLDIKLLKSQNIPPMVALGQHDLGFAGKDWVIEQGADVHEIMDLGFDPVRIVACIPEDWDLQSLRNRSIIAVSEYRRLTCDWLDQQGYDYNFLRSYGATEVFPPEDADLVVDNTATGTTLKANRLRIIDTLLKSSTRLIANKRAMDDPAKREIIDNLELVINGVMEGRRRVLLEMNCPEERLDDLVALLPAMKAPSIAKLYRGAGFAVKAAVPTDNVRTLIPALRKVGATDILETPIYKAIE